ncbi:MAG: mechanosensitive ion channel family protein [Pseudomonadota bacterium]|nr:mechanosensitive ion channel family protein [Pseudomonadota bacterium]
MKKSVALLIMLCAFFLFSPVSAEQESDSSYEQLETVDRSISLSEKNQDKAIEQKITRILESSGKFTDIDIRVKEGLVRINATAQSLQYVNWPSNVAQNVDGVIGVINDVSAQNINLLNFELFKSQFIEVGRSAFQVLPTVILGIIVFSLFFFLANPVTNIVMRPVSMVIDSKMMSLVIRRSLVTFICLLGLYMFLRIAGLTQIAVAIISGTGIIGLVIGFAFKDIAENYISSLLISARRPFQINDVIEIDGYTGVVQKVTLRGTTLVDFDGNHVQIPNSSIYKGTIKNFTANPNMRGSFIIGVGYDANITDAQLRAMEIFKQHQAVLDDPQPQVLVDNLGSSTINLKIYFWINAQEFALNKVSSDVMRLIVDEFLQANISMPDDAREVIFPQGVEVLKGDAVGEKESVARDTVINKVPDIRQVSTETLESDYNDVIKQASDSREPDEGEGII